MKSSFRRRVGRGSLAAALAAMLPLAFAVPAHAADAVDQYLDMAFWPSSQQNIAFMAQTFTATVTGSVDRVSLPADTPQHYAGVDVSIQGVTKTGLPNDIPIGSSAGMNGQLVNTAATVDHFHDFTFPPTGLPGVTQGTQYAIVVVVWGGNLKWYDTGSPAKNPYTGGKQYLGYPWAPTTHADFGFKEWVATKVNSAPTIAADHPGVSVPESTVPTMTGSYSDADTTDTVSLSASSGSVKWTGTSTGTWQWTGTAPDETPTQTVIITADDGHGLSNTASFTVVGTEITPTASANAVVPTDPALRSPLIITPGESLSFGGTFSDPATQDAHSGSWNFGDGTPAAGGWSTTHSYAQPGTYTVRLTASDDDNANGAATIQVTVQTAQQSLGQMIAYVQGLTSLNGGQRNSLLAKLNAASDAAARGDNKTASNQLNAFLNELQADYNTNKITLGAYNTLRLDAHTVQGSLGTFNRFLEWWPLQA